MELVEVGDGSAERGLGGRRRGARGGRRRGAGAEEGKEGGGGVPHGGVEPGRRRGRRLRGDDGASDGGAGTTAQARAGSERARWGFEFEKLLSVYCSIEGDGYAVR